MNDQGGTRIIWQSLLRFQQELSVLEGKSALFLSALTRESSPQDTTGLDEAILVASLGLALGLSQALSLAARMTRELEVVLQFTPKPTPFYTPDGKTAKDLPST